jgi:hypothetical protein
VKEPVMIANKDNLMDRAIADKIERDPQLLDIPLGNIERWLAQDHSAPHRLEQWRKIILEARADAEGLKRLLSILRDTGEKATHLKSFSPFAGVLTTRERRVIIQQCAWSH